MGGGGDRLKGRGAPSNSSGPDSTPKAFPYPNTSPNHISNRQKPPPPNRFHIPCNRSTTARELPRWHPPLQAKPGQRGGGGVHQLYSSKRRGAPHGWPFARCTSALQNRSQGMHSHRPTALGGNIPTT